MSSLFIKDKDKSTFKNAPIKKHKVFLKLLYNPDPFYDYAVRAQFLFNDSLISFIDWYCILEGY